MKRRAAFMLVPTLLMAAAFFHAVVLAQEGPIGTLAVLMAGQHIDAGTVTASSDGQFLTVTYQTSGGWVITETHLAVATSPADIPQKNGNPIPGKFPYKAEHSPPVTEYTLLIDLEDIGWPPPPGDPGDPAMMLCVAAHAVVVQLDADGEVVEEETAWAAGEDFPGKNWATYFFVEEQGNGFWPPSP